MTFEQQLNEAVAQAQVAHEAKHLESISALLTNGAFIDAQRSIAAKDNELRQLNTIIKQLNQIKPFISKDGTKYAIKCFPASFFGTGLAQIVGIISASRGAFTDELALQYSAITGISMIELLEAREALGSPMYLNQEPEDFKLWNIAKLHPLLASIMLKMGIKEFSPNMITEDKMHLWFTLSERKVLKEKEELEKTKAINASSDFTIED
jgi:hypothetical protein